MIGQNADRQRNFEPRRQNHSRHSRKCMACSYIFPEKSKIINRKG